MTKRAIRHQAISASAGTGKTFQLAHRYLQLLAHGVAPDRICALTFSRKAAGEIFDSIVEHLCNAACRPENASQTAARIGMPALRAEDFLELLRALMNRLNRLHIGTLDSFGIGVLRAFAPELGVPPDFDVTETEGAAGRALRRRVLQTVFAGRQANGEARRRFLAAFRQASFGHEEKALETHLDRFISEYRRFYLALPRASAWGEPAAIWPSGTTWLDPPGDVDKAADTLLQSLSTGELPEAVRGRWRAFVRAAGEFHAGAPWTRDIEYLFEKLAPVDDDLRRGHAEIVVDRKPQTLSRKQCRAARILVHDVVRAALTTALRRTAGIFRILDAFERAYGEAATRQGYVSFADAQYFLTTANPRAAAAVLSRQAGNPSRLYIDYRLDCELDHWLLDEFQDTSDLQWEVLSNLVDEVLQDDSGRRSLFYVGDVKQAIYGWREGNPRLFRDILEHYPGRIACVPLSTSFRSCPAVIDFVNAVFERLPESRLPGEVVRLWNGVWQTHRCSEAHVPSEGFAALVEPACPDDRNKPGAEDRYAVAAALLNRIQPAARGMTAAVLVRTNAQGREVVNLLRRNCTGLRIAHEGRASIRDNPVVAALLALVQFAEHPGDEFAWQHLRMTPLRDALRSLAADRKALPLALLEELQTLGYRDFIRAWGKRLARVQPLDGFGSRRLADLVEAAGEFEGGGGGSAADFARFVDNCNIRESGHPGAVRVMTVHQAKGLGFDVVILPDLMSGSLDAGGQTDFLVARGEGRAAPSWALAAPRRVIADQDPVLRAAWQAADHDACFEELCVLYVALTRARHAVYAVTSFPGRSSRALTAGALLKLQLRGSLLAQEGRADTGLGVPAVWLWERGKPDWFAGHPPRPAAEPPYCPQRLPRGFASRISHRTCLQRVEPSDTEHTVRAAASCFDRETGEVLEFGSAIHALLERVGWFADTDVERVIEEWSAAADVREHIRRDVVEQFRKAMASPEVQAALQRPGPDAELWREQRFEVILPIEGGSRWITGAFDRVTIRRRADGRARSAVILDFKSNRIGSEQAFARAARIYGEQQSLYAQALAHILALPAQAVGRQLLFTRAGRVVEMDRTAP